MKKNQLYREFFKLRKHAEKGQYILKGELTFKIWVYFFLTKMFQLLQKYYMQSFTAVAFSKLKL